MLLIPLVFALAVSGQIAPPRELYSPLVYSKVAAIANAYPKPAAYPQYTTSTGTWRWFNPFGWTSGFFPVMMYEVNRRTDLCPGSDETDTDWVEMGRKWSEGLIPLLTGDTSGPIGHDLGFISFPFVEELAINPTNANAINAIKLLADTLAKRFDPVVGCTRSWDSADPTYFQVIIDNLMNLELFFIASELTGDPKYRNMAIRHADQTAKYHIRPDGGSYHVVVYNSTTGAVLKRQTSQGYSDSSTWARGQAWGIYGFATMYSRTKDPKYLDTARRMGNYFINGIQNDGVVPWDFNAPKNPLVADTSAATLVSTAFLLLSQHETSKTQVKFWQQAAIKILRDTTKLAWRGSEPGWQSLLSNGTVHNPAGNKLTGIVYGDYYYIKAGNDLISLGLADC